MACIIMYDKNNIFAKIIRKEVPTTLLYEDENVIAFNDINPVAPVHVLVIPKGEYSDYTDFITKASAHLQLAFFKRIAILAKDLCGEHFKLCTNNGVMSGQTVLHFHVHIVGGVEFLGDKILGTI
jgi:histidine triad (HIT) family protein